jgi:hypothetical protein
MEVRPYPKTNARRHGCGPSGAENGLSQMAEALQATPGHFLTVMRKYLAISSG